MNAQLKEHALVAEGASSISSMDIMLNDEAMNRVMNLAKVMASSKISIPQHLRGSEGDCFAVVMQAAAWGMNPFAVAQKTHVINGALGYEAQLVNAVIITRAPVKDRLNFEWFGDFSKINGKESKSAEHGVKVWATMQGEDEPRLLELTMAQVGPVRNSPLWVADPRQQLAYLAIKRWSRLYCPDVILGVNSVDDLEEPPVVDVTPEKPKEHAGSANLKSRLQGKGKAATVVEGNATAVPSFDLTGFLTAVQAAHSLDELKKLAGSVPKDLAPELANQVNDAYKARKAELSQPPQPQAMPDSSIEAIIKEFDAAPDQDALDKLCDTRMTPFTGQMTEAQIDQLNDSYQDNLNRVNAQVNAQ